MNALFLTQAESLHMFYDLAQELRQPLGIERIGFLVSYYRSYERFTKKVPEIESGSYCVLKEWEVVSHASRVRPDMSLLQQYEEMLGDPSLWNALIADRRLYLGKKCTYFQDYQPRFSHNEMLALLQEGLVSMERMFDKVKPDFVASFICVTFLEYLAYLFAKARGVPFLNLRPTRIKNYVCYGESIYEPSNRVQATYHRYLANGIDKRWEEEARQYMNFVHTEHALYEGVSPPSHSHPLASRIATLPLGLAKTIGSEMKHLRHRVRDNHDPGLLRRYLYRQLLNPLRARWTHLILRHSLLQREDLEHLNYVFFPLHTEPENTLLVFSRPYLNQIEVVRNLAHSLPVGMKVVVKEHPASVGKRPLSYYQKLLEIPNVLLAYPHIDARPLISNSRLVATIAGSVGWEAVLRRKPVIILGHTPYEFLSPTMLRRVTDMEQMGGHVKDLLQNYCFQEEVVTTYVAAVMSQSAPVNLYSNLFGRVGVYSPAEGDFPSHKIWEKDLLQLSQYTIRSLGLEPALSSAEQNR